MEEHLLIFLVNSKFCSKTGMKPLIQATKGMKALNPVIKLGALLAAAFMLVTFFAVLRFRERITISFFPHQTKPISCSIPSVFEAGPFPCSFSSVYDYWGRSNGIEPRNMSLDRKAPSCPDYFKWIYEDLAPWQQTGISRDDISAFRGTAYFRVSIIHGILYSKMDEACYQTRFMFTLWGLSLLVDRYPGLIPDLEAIFSCDDAPKISRSTEKNYNLPRTPLFSYCSRRDALDIPFPDWSFWGWPEVNMDNWDRLSSDIYNVSGNLDWFKADPVAHFRGNLDMGPKVRPQLKNCKPDYAKIEVQNWQAETENGFQNTNPANQCGYRYKIYAEGISWSVGLKNILACGSPILFIKSEFYAFFQRGLLPLVHYLPIDSENVCSSLETAVKWGNAHPDEAQIVGKRGLEFLKKGLSTNNVYEYMLHLLSEYATLQRFQPLVPPGAVLVKPGTILCLVTPREREFMKQSLQDNLNVPEPCSMPPPDSQILVNTIGGKK